MSLATACKVNVYSSCLGAGGGGGRGRGRSKLSVDHLRTILCSLLTLCVLVFSHDVLRLLSVLSREAHYYDFCHSFVFVFLFSDFVLTSLFLTVQSMSFSGKVTCIFFPTLIFSSLEQQYMMLACSVSIRCFEYSYNAIIYLSWFY